ncbi:MAG: hypothetical protein ACKON8_03120, partial [Planctomycetota bacterium]
TDDVIKTWLKWKREKEIDPMRLLPHPYEFCLYFDALTATHGACRRGGQRPPSREYFAPRPVPAPPQTSEIFNARRHPPPSAPLVG